MSKEKLIIIGSGPAGLTAAIYAARANLEPLVISGKTPGGLLTQTSEVENFPGFPDGINGVALMMAMQAQAQRFGARIEIENVVKVDFSAERQHQIVLEDDRILTAEAVIAAVGASPRWLGLESETRYKNRGVSACATCDGAFYKEKDVVIAGGGDSAMEEALFLSKFASSVTIVHRRNEFRASKIMVQRVLDNPKIKVIWQSRIAEILGDQRVNAVKISNVNDNTETVLACQGLFVALGHDPDTKLFKDVLALDERGYIKLAGDGTVTSCPGVFAAGDCVDFRYRQAITAAGSGCSAAIDAERYLSE